MAKSGDRLTVAEIAVRDARLLRALLTLCGNELEELAQSVQPPVTIRRFVRRANRRQLHGLLIETLARLHTKRPNDST